MNMVDVYYFKKSYYDNGKKNNYLFMTGKYKKELQKQLEQIPTMPDER